MGFLLAFYGWMDVKEEFPKKDQRKFGKVSYKVRETVLEGGRS